MFPALFTPSLISGIYGVVCTPENGGDQAQCIVTRAAGSENVG